MAQMKKKRARVTIAEGSHIRIHVDDNDPYYMDVVEVRPRGRGYYSVRGRDIATGDYIDITVNPPPKEK